MSISEFSKIHKIAHTAFCLSRQSQHACQLGQDRLDQINVVRGNFGRWGNFGQGPKKHLTLSQSFDFLALVSALEVLTTVKKSKLQLKVKCFFSSCSKLPHLPKLPRSTVVLSVPYRESIRFMGFAILSNLGQTYSNFK